ncbi:MAG: hypothetical protein JXO49_12565 [Deltaproteobacteria bacterium]|nr:hypothetical protein [Candidatus Anaeroferrophillus wilburensis]MBN2890161.1 hypothetical protein [Deltaproteobacteria bacterium]
MGRMTLSAVAAPLLWQRAAALFERQEEWSAAASCWLKAGSGERAAASCRQGGRLLAAAFLLVDAGRISEALRCFESVLEPPERDDPESRIASRLGTAACLILQETAAKRCRLLYREARAMLAELDPQWPPLKTGRCWELLGWFGKTVNRYDLLQVGYEQALACYGARLNSERRRAVRDYLAAVRDNQQLIAALEIRSAEWELLGE